MEHGNLSTTDPEFGYCDDGTVTGEFYDSCLNCVASGGDTQYVANGMPKSPPSEQVHTDVKQLLWHWKLGVFRDRAR